ncbi:MAG: FG-GAP repeat domain-containing protein, partial [Verrucomicrobiia bacterium]
VPLPPEAQWSPAFGICIADFDGDGCEDVFLSQNFFAVNPDEWRHDAGRGLLLRGDGRGGLSPMPGQASGIKVYGEQRGCAVGDYDTDGRPDIVVTQNGNETKLFHNVSGKPGLRVRCVGPLGNPTGIGAAVRLRFRSGRFGAPREIQSGSGYWSRNSDTLVLATPEPPAEVWVRWPGGHEVSAPIPANAREIALDANGNARTIR